MRIDRRKDMSEGANSRLSQFCELASKSATTELSVSLSRTNRH